MALKMVALVVYELFLLPQLTYLLYIQIYKLLLECFRLGFVPNGNRIYFENRSQPPYFIPSVYEYYQSTDDFDFVKSLLPILEQEYSFWMSNRTVEVQKPGSEEMHLLNRYDVFMGKPRYL